MISAETIEQLQLITVANKIYIGLIKQEKNLVILKKRFEVSKDITKEEFKNYILTEYEQALEEDLKLAGQIMTVSSPLSRKQKFDLEAALREVEFDLETADIKMKAAYLRK